jgi:cytochrome b6-f complex iron-sulfur subunit
MNDKTNISRRDILKLITHGLLTISGIFSLYGLIKYLSYKTELSPPTEFDLGPSSDYPIGSSTILPYIPAVVIYNNKGYKALSLVCTHLGCTVEEEDNGFLCPCHGSRYNQDGFVLVGPANLPLRSLQIKDNDDGHLWVYTK